MARESTVEAIKQLEALHWAPGELVAWEAVEELLAPATRRDRRFQTIYRAWIRHQRRWHNRKVVVMPGQGLRVLREEERADDVCATLGKTWPILERAKTDVDDIQIVDLPATAVDDVHHIRVVTHRLHRALAQERAEIAQRRVPPAPSLGVPQRLPRLEAQDIPSVVTVDR